MPNPVYQQNDEPLEENSQPIERKNVVYNEVNDDIVRSVIFLNKMSFSNFNQYIRIMKIRLFYLYIVILTGDCFRKRFFC